MDFKALEGITPEQIMKMSPDDLQALLAALDVMVYDKTYNTAKSITPFSYQHKFFEAGSTFDFRLLSAANRVGKTIAGSLEMSYHVTGRYPDWWKGKRIEGSGRTYWCIGVNLQMVMDNQQKHLLGTANCGVVDELGTGMIPRDCIELDQGFEKDGARVIKCRIKHIDGGLNELAFFGSTDPNALMGRRVAACWCDEESPYSGAVFSQLIARTMNGIDIGEDGIIFITATPEEGETELWRKFANDKTGQLFFQNVTWWDLPELFTIEQIEKKLAALPDHEKELRSKGLPAVGKGAVFKIADELISVDEIHPLSHWQVVAAVDWGHVVDPTVIAICLHDPDNDIFYLYDLFYFDQDEQERSPSHVAKVLLSSEYAGVPVVVPHDSGKDSNANESNGKLLERLGVNVHPQVAQNPTETQLRMQKLGSKPRSAFNIETGLTEMRFLMNEGKLKINTNCNDWFREKHSYSYRFNERTRVLDYAGADHAIDASRYGFMSLLSDKGCKWENVSNLANKKLTGFNTVYIDY
ncbi:TPA: terminase family protein [Klebsiella aerogenes]|nr:terminase family protein [Klebsiella aerogenes]